MWGCNNTNCVFIPEHNTACYHVNINLTSGARKKSVILISAAGQQSVIWSTKLLYAESKAMTRWKLPQSWSSKAGTRSGDITDRNHNHHPTQHPMTTEQEAWERGRGLGGKTANQERRGRRLMEGDSRQMMGELSVDQIQRRSRKRAEKEKEGHWLVLMRTPPHMNEIHGDMNENIHMLMNSAFCNITINQSLTVGWTEREVLVEVCVWMTLQLRQWNSITAARKHSQWKIR